MNGLYHRYHTLDTRIIVDDGILYTSGSVTNYTTKR